MPLLKLEDIDLYYESSGDGDPLLLIHGLGSSARDWADQVQHFSQNYRVVVPDLRGHGQSMKPRGPCSIPMLAADVAALIEGLDLGPTHIVGLSLGGFIATELAIERGDLVRSAVIVNSIAELPRDTLGQRLRTRKELLLRILAIRLFGMRGLGRLVANKVLPHPEQAELREIFVERWSENDPKAYTETMAALGRWRSRERLPKITCPMCVVAGDEDFFPMELKEDLVSRVPDARLVVVANSGHLTPIDQLEKFNKIVEDFLAEH